ncbi:FecR family protein [Chitinophaga flava]|uniref:Iron dicitrate transport regulator FecR n=1 Tax=Chitinophaga flava TaxID=2259036 RepID=A0A365Y1F2_9BACT|nr:FecR family protein [Chitinophaga flava]RBL92446.1 iron dicitrate transport regulator FecR [Chitinophaga flava]
MQDRLLELFHKYVNDSCSEEELSELFELFSLTGNEITVKELIAQTIEDIDQYPVQISTFLSTADAENILREILSNTADVTTETNIQRRALFSRWWHWAAAAMVAALVGLSGYYYAHHSGNMPLARITPSDLNTTSGSNKATLTLSNGQTIALDSAQNGLLATQGQGRVVKTQTGEIIYSAEEKKDEKLLYNNISTPRGGQYSLQLSDGSKVWLNAASSIRFPVAFTTGERKVYITGEVYFEVKHLIGNHDQPVSFIVEADNNSATNAGYRVEVLGTKFNINTYSNEPFVSTTLLEGKVRVHADKTLQSQVLLPDQQVNINRKGEMNLNKTIDVNAVVAWKNGYTQFSSVPLSAVMRQIERWYDVNVQFEDHVTDIKFTGKLKRNENLSEFLKILDLNNIKYEISNSTIIIKNQ